ncbi:MAG: outer rane lipoproteinsorting protein [Pedosphaera sp.]|nr:outer rane lipoproteinsorting protein [Pedosphaera sp.]
MIRRNLIKEALVILVVCFLCGGISHAQDNSPIGPEAGQKLAAELRAQVPVDGEWKGTLTRNQKRKTVATTPVLGKVNANGGTWKVTYLASATNGKGAEQLTVVHSTNGPNEYLYAQAPSAGAPLSEPKKLSGAQADIPLAGSDFWLSDLGFEFYHWPQQVKEKVEMKRGRVCYVLESSNPNPSANGYSRVITWIDKESYEQQTGGPIQAEAYGPDKKLLKEFSLGSFKKIKGRWELKEMEIENVKTGSRTKLQFDLDAK